MNNGDMPASPTKHNSEHFQHSDHYTTGLTKREEFAVRIYAGMVTATTEKGEWCGLGCADMAVEQADLLLNALEDNNED